MTYICPFGLSHTPCSFVLVYALRRRWCSEINRRSAARGRPPRLRSPSRAFGDRITPARLRLLETRHTYQVCIRERQTEAWQKRGQAQPCKAGAASGLRTRRRRCARSQPSTNRYGGTEQGHAKETSPPMKDLARQAAQRIPILWRRKVESSHRDSRDGVRGMCVARPISGRSWRLSAALPSGIGADGGNCTSRWPFVFFFLLLFSLFQPHQGPRKSAGDWSHLTSEKGAFGCWGRNPRPRSQRGRVCFTSPDGELRGIRLPSR